MPRNFTRSRKTHTFISGLVVVSKTEWATNLETHDRRKTIDLTKERCLR